MNFLCEAHLTRKTNARLAGFTFLFYVATGIANLLTLCGFVSAVVLAVTLYALTRDEDRDLALLALCCRVSEGVIAAISAVRTLQLLAVAMASTAAAAPGRGGSARARRLAAATAQRQRRESGRGRRQRLDHEKTQPRRNRRWLRTR